MVVVIFQGSVSGQLRHVPVGKHKVSVARKEGMVERAAAGIPAVPTAGSPAPLLERRGLRWGVVRAGERGPSLSDLPSSPAHPCSHPAVGRGAAGSFLFISR